MGLISRVSSRTYRKKSKMFRNQYDHDVTVWSPQGRLFQLEYAMEAVKQGSATIGLKSNKYAVLVALKRAQNDLCYHQTKILPISQHCGLAMSGLTADGRRPYGVGLVVAGFDESGPHIYEPCPSANYFD